MEQRLHGLLSEHGLDRNSNFPLHYDASTRSYRVDGAVEVKRVLEAELNTTAPSSAAAAIREGYGLLGKHGHRFVGDA